MPDFLGDDMRKTKKADEPEKEEKEIKSKLPCYCFKGTMKNSNTYPFIITEQKFWYVAFLFSTAALDEADIALLKTYVSIHIFFLADTKIIFINMVYHLLIFIGTRPVH